MPAAAFVLAKLLDLPPLAAGVVVLFAAMPTGANAYKHPDEGKYVLDGLKQLSKTLKNVACVSARYLLTYGFELLQKVRDRFTGSVIDVSAETAADALVHLVKEKGAFWHGF